MFAFFLMTIIFVFSYVLPLSYNCWNISISKVFYELCNSEDKRVKFIHKNFICVAMSVRDSSEYHCVVLCQLYSFSKDEYC